MDNEALTRHCDILAQFCTERPSPSTSQAKLNTKHLLFLPENSVRCRADVFKGFSSAGQQSASKKQQFWQELKVSRNAYSFETRGLKPVRIFNILSDLNKKVGDRICSAVIVLFHEQDELEFAWRNILEFRRLPTESITVSWAGRYHRFAVLDGVLSSIVHRERWSSNEFVELSMDPRSDNEKEMMQLINRCRQLQDLCTLINLSSCRRCTETGPTAVAKRQTALRDLQCGSPKPLLMRFSLGLTQAARSMLCTQLNGRSHMGVDETQVNFQHQDFFQTNLQCLNEHVNNRGTSFRPFIIRSDEDDARMLLHNMLVHGTRDLTAQQCRTALMDERLRIIGTSAQRDLRTLEYVCVLYLAEDLWCLDRSKPQRIIVPNSHRGLPSSDTFTSFVPNLPEAQCGWCVGKFSNSVVTLETLRTLIMKVQGYCGSNNQVKMALYLDNVNASAEHADLVRGMLISVPNISRLSLANNHIGDAGFASVMKATLSTSSNGREMLRDLNVQWNEVSMVGAKKAAELIANAIRDICSSLRTLSLWGNPIGDDGAIDLVNAFRDFGRLQHLNIEHCGLTDISGDCLQQFISRARGLVELMLGDNRYTDHSAILFGDALTGNTTLRVLNLDGNDIKRSGVEAIFQAQSCRFSSSVSTTTPVTLKVDISRNPVEFLPSSVWLMDCGFDIEAKECRNLINPPRSIVEQGFEATRGYLHAMRSQKTIALSSHKAVLLGHSRAGKTRINREVFLKLPVARSPHPEEWTRSEVRRWLEEQGVSHDVLEKCEDLDGSCLKWLFLHKFRGRTHGLLQEEAIASSDLREPGPLGVFCKLMSASALLVLAEKWWNACIEWFTHCRSGASEVRQQQCKLRGGQTNEEFSENCTFSDSLYACYSSTSALDVRHCVFNEAELQALGISQDIPRQLHLDMYDFAGQLENFLPQQLFLDRIPGQTVFILVVSAATFVQEPRSALCGRWNINANAEQELRYWLSFLSDLFPQPVTTNHREPAAGLVPITVVLTHLDVLRSTAASTAGQDVTVRINNLKIELLSVVSEFPTFEMIGNDIILLDYLDHQTAALLLNRVISASCQAIAEKSVPAKYEAATGVLERLYQERVTAKLLPLITKAKLLAELKESLPTFSTDVTPRHMFEQSVDEGMLAYCQSLGNLYQSLPSRVGDNRADSLCLLYPLRWFISLYSMLTALPCLDGKLSQDHIEHMFKRVYCDESSRNPTASELQSLPNMLLELGVCVPVLEGQEMRYLAGYEQMYLFPSLLAPPPSHIQQLLDSEVADEEQINEVFAANSALRNSQSRLYQGMTPRWILHTGVFRFWDIMFCSQSPSVVITAAMYASVQTNVMVLFGGCECEVYKRVCVLEAPRSGSGSWVVVWWPKNSRHIKVRIFIPADKSTSLTDVQHIAETLKRMIHRICERVFVGSTLHSPKSSEHLDKKRRPTDAPSVQRPVKILKRATIVTQVVERRGVNDIPCHHKMRMEYIFKSSFTQSYADLGIDLNLATLELDSYLTNASGYVVAAIPSHGRQEYRVLNESQSCLGDHCTSSLSSVDMTRANIVGFLIYEHSWSERHGHFTYVSQLAVDVEHWNQGTGRALMERLRALAEDRQNDVRLLVRKQNSRAEEFYLRLGLRQDNCFADIKGYSAAKYISYTWRCKDVEDAD